MTKRSWHELPANAKTIMDVQCCIDFLEQHHPYPANMQPDRDTKVQNINLKSLCVNSLKKLKLNYWG